MTEPIIEARLVVLPGRVWQSELASQLERLGVDPAMAPAAAADALHRIVANYGWPRGVIEVASSDGDPPVDLEAAEEPSRAKRFRAASRRRWVEAAK